MAIRSKFKWCKKQIKIIEPNYILAKEYISSAQETATIFKSINSNMWKATMKYYAEYFATYAMLTRLGIRTEIHDCTIELAKFLEKQNILPEGTTKTLQEDKELRIDNQYYLKNTKINATYEELNEFILKINEKITKLTLDEVENIRAAFEQETTQIIKKLPFFSQKNT